MRFKGSFSKLWERLKHPVVRDRHNPGRKEASVTEEKVDLANSALQPQPAVVGDRHDREGNGTKVEGIQGSVHSDVEATVENEPSQEGTSTDGERVDRTDPPASTPLTTHSEEPNGMCTKLLQLLSLIIPPGDVLDAPAVPNDVQEILSSGQSEPNVEADQEKSDQRKSTASATTEPSLRGANGSADPSGPLNSVVEGLSFILENCEVRLSSLVCCPQRSQRP